MNANIQNKQEEDKQNHEEVWHLGGLNFSWEGEEWEGGRDTGKEGGRERVSSSIQHKSPYLWILLFFFFF